MEDPPRVKKDHSKSARKKSPDSRNDPNDEHSQSKDKNSQNNKRRKEREGENPRKYFRHDKETNDDYEASRYDRYWSGRDEKAEKEFEKRDKRYIPRERYWGDGGDKSKDSRKDKPDKFRKFDDDKYLVGSRYYEEPKAKKKSSPKPTNDEGLTKDNSDKENGFKEPPKEPPRKKTTDIITSRTGGAYIPPGKLKLMQASITDKSSAEYQRIAWEALKKSIHGHINKVNTSNIGVVARLLFKENIIRGRGLLCRSIIQAQSASVTFTNVYACLVAIINSKFPNIGELLLKRVIIRFKRAYKRNDKAVCISSATFIAHLINQRVAHEILGLELVTLLVENPTDDSIEVAVSFLKEAGQKLSEVSSRGTNAIFDMLRNILHEGKLEKRVQYMIEVMFQVRKDDFATFPSVPEELDLVDEEDQFTHILSLDDAIEAQEILNVFKLDTEYQVNEEKYKELRNEILETDSEGSGSGSEDSSSGEDDSDEEGEDEDGEKKITIVDNTETNLVAFRKTIYLTIQSSLDFEECAHKLLKMEIKPGQEKELCHMFLDCCAEQRTYEKFFGLLSQRFCQVNKMFITPFEEIFAETYATVHRLDTNRLRNVAKLFAHLLFTDAISWAVLVTIRLNEEDTTSSSRIFIKILFQELSEYMGLANLNSRLKDPTLQSSMEGLFPRDNPKNTRFAINFFTSIGLGGLTDELREHLKNLPKPVPVSQLIQELSSATSSSSSSDDSSSESDSSSSSSSSSSSDDGEAKKKKKGKSKKVQGDSKSKKMEKNKNDVVKDRNKNKKSSESNSNFRENEDEEMVMRESRQKGMDHKRQRPKQDEERERFMGDERPRDGNDRWKSRGDNERTKDNRDQRRRHGPGAERDWDDGQQLRNRDHEMNSEERHRHRNNSNKHSAREHGDQYDRHNSEKHREWDNSERSRNRDNSERNNTDKHRSINDKHKGRDNSDWQRDKDLNDKHRNRENSERHRDRETSEKHRGRDKNEKCRNREKGRAREDNESHRGKVCTSKRREKVGGDNLKGRDSDD